MRRLLTISLTITCMLLIGAFPAQAVEEAVVTLDAGTVPPAIVCGGVWVESSIQLSFVPQTADDCGGGGACFFGIGGLDPDGVDLYPARLEGTFGLLGGAVLAAQADVIDYCGNNCTRLFLYNGGAIVASAGNTTTGALETLHVDGGGNPVDRIAVSSCEGAVVEMRIRYEPVLPTEAATWGAVKALFDE